jgi:hypothetical protein
MEEFFFEIAVHFIGDIISNFVLHVTGASVKWIILTPVRLFLDLPYIPFSILLAERLSSRLPAICSINNRLAGLIIILATIFILA